MKRNPLQQFLLLRNLFDFFSVFRPNMNEKRDYTEFCFFIQTIKQIILNKIIDLLSGVR